MRPGLDFPGIAIAKETRVAYNPFRKSLGVVPLLCDWESIRRIREIGWKTVLLKQYPITFTGRVQFPITVKGQPPPSSSSKPVTTIRSKMPDPP